MSMAPLAGGTSRQFTLCERFRYDYTRPVTNLCQRLKVVPPPTHGAQVRRGWHLSVCGVPLSTRRTSIDLFGNLTIHVEVARVDVSVEFVLYVEADLAGSAGPDDTVVDRGYLGHTLLTEPGKLTTELAEGAGFADVGALCARVHASIEYGWGFTSIGTTASQALAVGRGVCQDYAHIMLSACRTAGLPARYVSGHLVGEGGSHAWVEVLHPHPDGSDTWMAEGWDPTQNRRTNADYLVVAVGRDYADAAPLSGTFVGKGATSTLSVTKSLIVTKSLVVA